MSLDLAKFKVYAVGGYVRDRLLGRDPKDHDYVVCGATPSDMISAGFEPIEAAFPIFIDPRTRDEYALARKERKTGVGYYGFEVEFDPTVTLEEDLFRRDLTMNAMAREVIGWNEQGHAKLSDDILDPYDGQGDMWSHTIRHVSEAFAEDPVRVLRTARFASRYGFDVHPETLELMGQVAPELNHVPQERIWAEIEKTLSEKYPCIMFDLLDACGAMEVEALAAYRNADLMRLMLTDSATPLHVKFCLIALGFNEVDYEPYRIPTDFARVSKAFNKHLVKFITYPALCVEERVKLFDQARAFSDPATLVRTLDVFKMYDDHVDTGKIVEHIMADLSSALTVSAEVVAKQCSSGAEIKQKLFDTRVAAIQHK